MKKTRKRQLLRPTSSMVKNALFNILGDIDSLRFIDLFAGTGQIGMEAERRGAEVVFVEKNHLLAGEIKKRTRAKVIVGDVLKVIGKLEEADIIFADPPYSFKSYDELIEKALKKLSFGGIFILEHDKRKEFGADEVRKYGDTVLSIWIKEL